MAALVVHASKDRKSKRTLYINPVIAVAKARGLSKSLSGIMMFFDRAFAA